MNNPGQIFSLEWLLHPIAPADFFRAQWETEPLWISRNNPDYFRGLPSVDTIDELITSTTSGRERCTISDGLIARTEVDGTLSERPFRLDSNGIPDIQDIYRAYHAGYTIVVNQLHRRSAAVAGLCREIEVTLHHPVGANLYLTPRDAQGFRPHVDTHDVFILHLHGEKVWNVGSPSYPLPLASSTHRPTKSVLDFCEYRLTPGDVLYLPRGFPHDATTGATSSLHLTLGVNVYRWMDFFLEAITLVAANRVDFRSAMPPGFLEAEVDPLRVSSLASQLMEALSDGALRERAKERLNKRLLNAAKAAGRGHFNSIDAIANLSEDSIIIRAPGHLCRVRSNADESLIEFSTNYVAGPGQLEPAMRFIAERQSFAVRDLPGPLTTADKIDFVSRLIAEGLLKCSGEIGR